MGAFSGFGTVVPKAKRNGAGARETGCRPETAERRHDRLSAPGRAQMQFVWSCVTVCMVSMRNITGVGRKLRVLDEGRLRPRAASSSVRPTREVGALITAHVKICLVFRDDASCQIWWPRTWLASSCSGVMPPPQHQARADPLELLWSRASCSFQVRRIHKSSLLRALAAAHSSGQEYVFLAPSMSWFACAPRSVGLLALAAIVLVRVGIDVF